MPARDKYHDIVRNALIKDGWEITDDPFSLKIGERDAFIDIGAEKLFTAEKEGRKIAVEIKSFIGKINHFRSPRCLRAIYNVSGSFERLRSRPNFIFGNFGRCFGK